MGILHIQRKKTKENGETQQQLPRWLSCAMKRGKYGRFFFFSEPTHPPRDVRVYNATSTSIMVQWDEAQPAEGEKVEGYRLNYTALPDGDQTLKTVDASNNTELTLEGLKQFTEYNICVLAFYAQGNGPMSCKIARTAKDGTFLFAVNASLMLWII